MLRKVQCFFSLKMSVNLNQNRGTIGVFNVSIIVIKIKQRPKPSIYKHLVFSSTAFSCFTIKFPSKKFQNLTHLYRSNFLLYILHSSMAVQVKNISEQQYWNQSRSCAKKVKTNHFLSAFWILIVLLPMVMPKHHCLQLILQPTKWISFVYQKPILTLPYNRIMII